MTENYINTKKNLKSKFQFRKIKNPNRKSFSSIQKENFFIYANREKNLYNKLKEKKLYKV